MFRNKPVEIEALQFTGGVDSARTILTWTNDTKHYTNGGYSLFIETLTRVQRADAGDWIIRGVKGEFYPCKPDIFEKTFEPA